MSRKIILIKQELLLLVYELNRSGLLAENEKIRPILAQLEKLLDRKSGSAGMPRPISYAVFCLKKKNFAGVRLRGEGLPLSHRHQRRGGARAATQHGGLRGRARVIAERGR